MSTLINTNNQKSDYLWTCMKQGNGICQEHMGNLNGTIHVPVANTGAEFIRFFCYNYDSDLHIHKINFFLGTNLFFVISKGKTLDFFKKGLAPWTNRNDFII